MEKGTMADRAVVKETLLSDGSFVHNVVLVDDEPENGMAVIAATNEKAADTLASALNDVGLAVGCDIFLPEGDAAGIRTRTADLRDKLTAARRRIRTLEAALKSELNARTNTVSGECACCGGSSSRRPSPIHVPYMKGCCAESRKALGIGL
jgi:hypothetical protein